MICILYVYEFFMMFILVFLKNLYDINVKFLKLIDKRFKLNKIMFLFIKSEN